MSAFFKLIFLEKFPSQIWGWYTERLLKHYELSINLSAANYLLIGIYTIISYSKTFQIHSR